MLTSIMNEKISFKPEINGSIFQKTTGSLQQGTDKSGFNKLTNVVTDAAATILTSGSSKADAHVSPLIFHAPLHNAAASTPAIAVINNTNKHNKNVKFKQSENELREKTVQTVSIFMCMSPDGIFNFLITPPRARNKKANILSSSSSSVVNNKAEEQANFIGDTKSDWYDTTWLGESTDLNNNTAILAAKFAEGVAGGMALNGAIFKASSIRHVGSFIRGAGLLGAGVMVAEAFGIAAEFERDNFMYTEEYENIINNSLISQERKDTLFDESIKRQALARKEAEHLKNLGTKFKENPTIFGLGVGSFLTIEKLPGATFASNAFMNLRIRFPFKSVANDRHLEYLNKVVKAPTGMEHIEVATCGTHGFENFSTYKRHPFR